MARWLIDVDASDDDTIQAYAGDSFAFGTEHDIYVAYVVVTTFIERMKKNVDKEGGQCILVSKQGNSQSVKDKDVKTHGLIAKQNGVPNRKHSSLTSSKQ